MGRKKTDAPHSAMSLLAVCDRLERYLVGPRLVADVTQIYAERDLELAKKVALMK